MLFPDSSLRQNTRETTVHRRFHNRSVDQVAYVALHVAYMKVASRFFIKYM